MINFQVGQEVYLKEPHAYGGPVTVAAVSTNSICVRLHDSIETLLCFYQRSDGNGWYNGRRENRNERVVIRPIA